MGRNGWTRFRGLRQAGGGINSGQMFGNTDELGYHAIDVPVHAHGLQATILHCLGIDYLQLAYRHKELDFRLTDIGADVIEEILS